MFLRPQEAVALRFKNRDDFRKALEILWALRKTMPEAISFALPPAENTFIIPKKYLSKFKELKPVRQEVGSVADLHPSLSLSRLVVGRRGPTPSLARGRDGFRRD